MRRWRACCSAKQLLARTAACPAGGRALASTAGLLAPLAGVGSLPGRVLTAAPGLANPRRSFLPDSDKGRPQIPTIGAGIGGTLAVRPRCAR